MVCIPPIGLGCAASGARSAAAASANAGTRAAAAFAAGTARTVLEVVGSIVVKIGIAAAAAVAAVCRLAALCDEAAPAGDIERHVRRERDAGARACPARRIAARDVEFFPCRNVNDNALAGGTGAGFDR